ncbi:hypothetical protein IKE67_07125 [bacterium]|nr:hypothetical protein [bacterium]
MSNFNVEIKDDVILVQPKNYKSFFRVQIFDCNGFVHKSGFLINKEYKYKLTEECLYYVKIKNLFNCLIYEKKIDFYKEITKKEFEDLCNNDYPVFDELKLNPLNLQKTPKPFKDFAIIKNNKSVSENFLKNYDFTTTKVSKNLEILSDKELNKKDVIFSGLMNYENTLILGEDDLKEDIKKRFNTDDIGYFTYLKRNNNDIEIGNDYLGNGKIFYYKNEESLVISNNYHLLLLILKDINFDLKLDLDILSSIICFEDEISLQLLSRKREIVGTYLLPIDEKIIVNSKNYVFKKKEIYKIIGKNKLSGLKESLFTNKEKLLDDGIKEIENNLKTVITDDRFKDIIIDLTGGLDSRVVFGIANTKLKEELQNKKVYLQVGGNLEDIDKENTDISIACKINSEYNYDYKRVSGGAYKIPDKDFVSSTLLYGSWEYVTSLKQDSISDEYGLNLSGGNGEAFLRPYYSRVFLNKKLHYERFVRKISKSLSLNTFLKYKKVLTDELKLMPGRDISEQFENHYLFYANNYHFYRISRYLGSYLAIKTIHSKSLLKYKYLTWKQHFIPAEENFRILEKIDKKLLFTPCNKPLDEKERLEYIKKKYGKKTNPYFEYDTEKIKQEKEKYIQSRNIPVSTQNENFNENEFNKNLSYEDKFKYVLNQLVHCNGGILKEEFGLELYRTLKNNALNSSKKMMLYYKILTILFEAKLIENINN